MRGGGSNKMEHNHVNSAFLLKLWFQQFLHYIKWGSDCNVLLSRPFPPPPPTPLSPPPPIRPNPVPAEWRHSRRSGSTAAADCGVHFPATALVYFSGHAGFNDIAGCSETAVKLISSSGIGRALAIRPVEPGRAFAVHRVSHACPAASSPPGSQLAGIMRAARLRFVTRTRPQVQRRRCENGPGLPAAAAAAATAVLVGGHPRFPCFAAASAPGRSLASAPGDGGQSAVELPLGTDVSPAAHTAPRLTPADCLAAQWSVARRAALDRACGVVLPVADVRGNRRNHTTQHEEKRCPAEESPAGAAPGSADGAPPARGYRDCRRRYFGRLARRSGESARPWLCRLVHKPSRPAHGTEWPSGRHADCAGRPRRRLGPPLTVVSTLLLSLPALTLAVFPCVLQEGTMLCDSRNLTAVPDLSDQPADKVTELRLERNAIRDVSGGPLVNLTALRLLSLDWNSLADLPEDLLDGSPALEVLQVGWNQLSALPPRLFDNLAQLRVLRAANNLISELDNSTFASTPLLETVDLRSNMLTSLEPGTFTGLKNLKEVILEDNHLSLLPPKTFGSNPNLVTLMLGKNSLTEVPADVSGAMPSLQYLDLADNSLSVWERGAFRELQQLQTLLLSRNNLSSLTAGALDNLPELTELRLNEIGLTTLHRDLFVKQTSLRSLQLRNNSLARVAPGTFRFNGRLASLYLDNNHLADIEVGTFDHQGELAFLVLSGNRLTTLRRTMFTRLPRLSTLIVNDNRVTSVDRDTFWDNPLLSVLSIIGNAIERLPADLFSRNPNLQEVRLRINRLSLVQPGTFRNNSRLQYLELDHNLLQTMDVSVIEPLVWLKGLTLEGNPWTCDCALEPLFTKIRKHGIVVRADPAICASPLDLKGKEVLKVVGELQCG
ncbi:insulin-like growth factor-binding protein complex acid labile subunit [Schistocerca serialis cubense]|uniref:insulin-like growth factor-binding protein complex acid labile subunit n=1 Tax=Schistocerca serialis cubense TaxID=2023355 RepID=UPI00214E971B|nr:insulin-like growth factor-binding protein complex acid labile subunit [Schistocerca serialis cubense]